MASYLEADMDDLSGAGTLVTLVILFGIVWAFLWLFVPFMIYSIYENAKRMARAAEKTASETETMRKIQEADVLDLGKKDRAA